VSRASGPDDGVSALLGVFNPRGVWHTLDVRRLLLGLVVVLGCGAKDEPAPAPPAPEQGGSESGSAPESEPVAPQVPIDEARRFVKEDLDRFMEAYPTALSASHAELFKTCSGVGCLEHGVSASVGPFQGAGTRYLVPLWLRGCLTGSGEACLLAGRTYQSSRFTPDSEVPTHENFDADALARKFRQYIALACDLDASKCEQWADYTLGDEKPSEADVTRAVQRLRAGCEGGAHGSCAALARHANDTPALGDARPWWKQACAKDPAKDSRHCASYANALFATGERADTEAAAKVLGPICDAKSATWASQCKGDPELALEACEFTYLIPQGAACVQLAKTLPPEDALRLQAALCVSAVLQSRAHAVGKQACRRAKVLAAKLGRSAAYRENLRKRTCELTEACVVDEDFGFDTCSAAKKACIAAAG